MSNYVFKDNSYTYKALQSMYYHNNQSISRINTHRNKHILFTIQEETQADIDYENNSIEIEEPELAHSYYEYSDSYAHSESFTLDDTLLE